eukprot:Gregarina_sp_Poly_1__619@NODE_1146_length_4945_cov_64_803813_g790_i0_p5_GENE_NODE_1146_length_4945_cov_64_803813_g790_i0NODE_1146_length_4945_cov_64_803813_g790_i0_p5_ORF_typecomplete_len113_score7_31Zip/PF02535_22/1_5e10Claudin_2/PF13903_6/0_0015ECFribofla_trS/PF07155_12/4_5e02ECFribofla_trS/PF07155_12/1_4_NODE_1146_length_4945_cov_64_803813_g790_i020652403
MSQNVELMRVAVMIAISIGFSLMSPLGSWIGFVSCSSSHMLSNSVNGYYMLIASGTFLFIALVEFLPNSFDEGSKGPGSISVRPVFSSRGLLIGSFVENRSVPLRMRYSDAT